MKVMEIANSAPMWIACGAAVGLVIVQAFIFGKNAYKAGKKIGLSEEQMRRAMRSSMIASVGPSLVILSGLLSLMVTVGGPMAWMRLSFIGSVMFESMAAAFGAGAAGVQIGADEMTKAALGTAIWTMILGSIGWTLFATFSADKMEKVQKKIVGDNTVLLAAISSSAFIGAASSLSAQHFVKLNKYSIACGLGAIIMLLLLMAAKKKNLKWLNDWAFTISIFAGMIITALV